MLVSQRLSVEERDAFYNSFQILGFDPLFGFRARSGPPALYVCDEDRKEVVEVGQFGQPLYELTVADSQLKRTKSLSSDGGEQIKN